MGIKNDAERIQQIKEEQGWNEETFASILLEFIHNKLSIPNLVEELEKIQKEEQSFTEH